MRFPRGAVALPWCPGPAGQGRGEALGGVIFEVGVTDYSIVEGGGDGVCEDARGLPISRPFI